MTIADRSVMSAGNLWSEILQNMALIAAAIAAASAVQTTHSRASDDWPYNGAFRGRGRHGLPTKHPITNHKKMLKRRAKKGYG